MCGCRRSTGGAGPAYGGSRCGAVRTAVGRGTTTALTSRQRTRDGRRSPSPRRGRRPTARGAEDVEESDAAFETRDERRPPLPRAGDRTVGAVCLCHPGCAPRQQLVVPGPAAGRIRDDDRADDLDPRPATGPGGTPLTFATWYDA